MVVRLYSRPWPVASIAVLMTPNDSFQRSVAITASTMATAKPPMTPIATVVGVNIAARALLNEPVRSANTIIEPPKRE